MWRRNQSQEGLELSRANIKVLILYPAPGACSGMVKLGQLNP